MSLSYHVNMHHTHFQTFKKCCRSVVTIVAKCIFNITLGKSCCNVVTLRKVYSSRVLSDKFCDINYYKCVIMIKFFYYSFWSH